MKAIHTKKYIKKQRELPKFRPLPTKLADKLNTMQNYFASFKTYTRFYGDYRTLTGRTRRFSFQVLLDSGLRGYEKYQDIRTICNRILQNKVPNHEPGEVFGFHELLHHTQWFPVRKIIKYKVGVPYGPSTYTRRKRT